MWDGIRNIYTIQHIQMRNETCDVPLLSDGWPFANYETLGQLSRSIYMLSAHLCTRSRQPLSEFAPWVLEILLVLTLRRHSRFNAHVCHNKHGFVSWLDINANHRLRCQSVFSLSVLNTVSDCWLVSARVQLSILPMYGPDWVGLLNKTTRTCILGIG